MIYIIRHTSPRVDKGVCYGQSDLDLSDTADIELNNVRNKLNLSDHIKFISSPLIRCTKLASFLSNNTFDTDNRLLELNFGEWEMKPWTQINADELKVWGNNYLINCPPKGESFTELYNRVVDFWNSLDVENTDYVITAHDGVIKCLLVLLLEIPLKKAFTIKLKYGAVTKVNIIDSENCNIEFL